MADSRGIQENQPNQEINWPREMGREMADGYYYYPLPKDPEIIGRMVTAAVYKLLTSEEMGDSTISAVMEDHPATANNEEMEVFARGFISTAQDICREASIQAAHQEALKNGRKAEQRFVEDPTCVLSFWYDDWYAFFIKGGVLVQQHPTDPNLVLLKVPMAELAGKIGVPKKLLYRVLVDEILVETGKSSLDYLAEICERLGFDYEIAIRDMFDAEARGCFLETLNEHHHTYPDEVRNAIVDSGGTGKRKLTAAEQYGLLNDEEREGATIHRRAELNAFLECELHYGSSSATLGFEFKAIGEAWFDPETMQMEGVVNPSERDAVIAMLYPCLGDNTNHDELLALRRQAQTLCDELGIRARHDPWDGVLNN